MKINKMLLVMAVPLLTIFSCTNETTASTAATQISQSEAVGKFNAAIRKVAMMKEPDPSQPRTSAELSDEKKDLLIPAAKGLIVSSGISMAEIERQTANDREKILKWAVKVYGDYNRQMNQNYKSQN
ncbi:hypothetical protein [Chryseobacterium hagamense]|uniref:Uncharacterized protein n=1 Tax=Chryseobacterium hagamense TaxID=395935 RepID=A0A511YKC0_9FLAO|nr:hypothetical protein [Chryseobacterium hagamense]GEN75648.1 hypothetical protein CHA01nite_13880 [Chryseobacterium hagamense]